ncbi:hypothetical protein [Xanthocytophaga flava]|uniref:hypothetical protein n=1 Tax=Xanthocytophaga flava TaxID=3048013 RepID=UPI0028D31039|nr:hypothetical protein [Xanthocytophaga flavus]MDJ1470392.1 hypothetical protein [Xanthocytophaga flavus]
MWSYWKNIYDSFFANNNRSSKQKAPVTNTSGATDFHTLNDDGENVDSMSGIDKKAIVKTEVIRLLSSGEPIPVDWNAGGDETLCNVKVGDSYNYKKDGVNIGWELGDLIAQILELPNAGEYFNNGHGRIEIDQNGQIVLHYSARAYYYDYEESDWVDGEPAENVSSTEWIPVDDPFHLNQYLHRVNINFSVWMHVEGRNTITYDSYGGLIHTQVREGDEMSVPIPKEAEAFYGEIIRKRLQKFEKDFEFSEEVAKSKSLHSIDVSGRLEEGGVRLELQKSYVVIDFIADNESVVLIK